ncbi:ABC transporter substrate-binding protein [Bradyrhizobium jicamae]|uniref:ABC transporter substrate-binding protein n=1 Tax=Bradyrhizobium jicamae TaxID=280332 RepID=A0ABS5FY02_9BRAD|nr:ABC transporter substrate-binding protein [Bradyrhizobium jicamae]MBR0801704.1 ABC transporter substrate-binding protein [Bradyrhizobium jicamae]
MYSALRHLCCVAILTGAFGLSTNSLGQTSKRYDPGASDTEIKVGNIMPYSGPASAYGIFGRTEAAYIRKINAEGGINGRKINFISYDDGYSPPKTVEQARKLVESDEVLLIFSSLGTPTNTAIHQYMNSRKVPQLFVATSASKWNDPKRYPWTIGFGVSYESEARIYAAYILNNYPGKTIGVLYQYDDLGKDYLKGLHEGLGDKAGSLITAEVSYDVTNPTVEPQVVRIKDTHPDIFINISTPKFAAQAIRKMAELNWKPVHILASVSNSIGAVLQVAGYENSQDLLSASPQKDVDDPELRDDPGVQEWRIFMTKWYPDGDQNDGFTRNGFLLAKALERVLRQCGDDLTRENVMRQASNLDFEIGLLLPGIRVTTSPNDFAPIKQLQMMRFIGRRWERFGPILDSEKLT